MKMVLEDHILILGNRFPDYGIPKALTPLSTLLPKISVDWEFSSQTLLDGNRTPQTVGSYVPRPANTVDILARHVLNKELKLWGSVVIPVQASAV